MRIEQLCSEHRVINIFVELAEIPSPSLREERLSKRILDIFSMYGVNAKKDSYGNIIAKVSATPDCKNVEPILLSAHMDVVGGASDILVKLSDDMQFIETDKKRTLGADNKAGIAVIMDLAIALNSLNNNIPHGDIEITFTRDEEFGMTGIRNLDTSNLKSKYALIADGEKLGELDVSGAGITQLYLNVKNGKGGHSGIDIDDNSRVSAIKVLSEIIAQIPQGVYEKNEKGVVTSINAGMISGGSVPLYLKDTICDIYNDARNKKPLSEKFNTQNIEHTVLYETPLNIIAQSAQIAYSIRSSDPDKEKDLIRLIKNIANATQKKYGKLIDINYDVIHHVLPFVESEDKKLLNAVLNAGQKYGIKSEPKSFHAGAETHILSNEKKNYNNETFSPLLIGIADIFNMHSSDEKIDWQTLLKGREWLEEIIYEFAKQERL